LSPYANYLLETLLTLVAVCGLAAFVLYGARRVGVGRATGGLELIGRLPLDARRSILLVKIGETVFVIGVGDGGMTKLGEVAASAVPVSVAAEPKTFATVLAQVLGRGEKSAAARAIETPREASKEAEP
jgi:flagellar protein FliO/FliZ